MISISLLTRGLIWISIGGSRLSELLLIGFEVCVKEMLTLLLVQILIWLMLHYAATAMFRGSNSCTIS